MALLDDALRPRSVAQDVRVGIDLVLRNRWLGPVEVARPVGAGGHAVAAADAPVVVDHDDAVGLLPGGADRAHLGARRVVALLAGDGEVEVALARHLVGLVVGVGVLEIDAVALAHLEHADVVHLGIARQVVLVDAGVDAPAAADAASDVERVGEHDAVDRRLDADSELDAIGRLVFALEAPLQPLDVRGRELAEVALKELLARLRAARGEQRARARGAHELQESAPAASPRVKDHGRVRTRGADGTDSLRVSCAPMGGGVVLPTSPCSGVAERISLGLRGRGIGRERLEAG